MYDKYFYFSSKLLNYKKIISKLSVAIQIKHVKTTSFESLLILFNRLSFEEYNLSKGLQISFLITYFRSNNFNATFECPLSVSH